MNRLITPGRWRHELRGLDGHVLVRDCWTATWFGFVRHREEKIPLPLPIGSEINAKLFGEREEATARLVASLNREEYQP